MHGLISRQMGGSVRVSRRQLLCFYYSYRAQQSRGFLGHGSVKHIIAPFLCQRVRHRDRKLILPCMYQSCHIQTIRRTDTDTCPAAVYKNLRRLIYTAQIQIIFFLSFILLHIYGKVRFIADLSRIFRKKSRYRQIAEK